MVGGRPAAEVGLAAEAREARASRRSSCSQGDDLERAGARGGGEGGRRAGDGRRRRLAGAGRGDRRRARPSVRLHPLRDPQPLRPRPRRRPRRRRRRPRRLRRRGRALCRPGGGQRAGSSSTTSRSASTPRRSARTATARRSCGRCSTRSPTRSGPTARPASCAGPTPTAPRRPAPRWSWSPTTRTCSARPSARAPGRGWTRGVLGIVDFHPPIAGTGEQAARWRELTAPELEIEADGPVPVGIDGEAVTLEPPLRFRSPPRALQGPDRPQPSRAPRPRPTSRRARSAS